MGGGITFRDLLTILVLAFVFIIVAMLAHLNPPATNDDAEPPGNVIATITWPEGNIDVDLWVLGPGEPKGVGYSNSNGLLWNLLRDDLGTFPDATPLNYENAYTRGIFAGEYVVNVHCYRCPTVPVPVDVEIAVKRLGEGKKGLRLIATTRADLRFNGEEVTALRFRLDADGKLVDGSLNHLHKPLRNMSKGG